MFVDRYVPITRPEIAQDPSVLHVGMKVKHGERGTGVIEEVLRFSGVGFFLVFF